MNIVDFWKNNGHDNIQIPEDKQANNELEQLLAQFPFGMYVTSATVDKTISLLQEYFPDTAEGKNRLLYYSYKLLQSQQETNWNENGKEQRIRKVFTVVLDNFPSLTDEEFLVFLSNWRKATSIDTYYNAYGADKVFRITQRLIKTYGLTEPLRKCLELTKTSFTDFLYSENRKLLEKIDFILQGEQEVPVNLHDRLGPVISDFVASVADRQQKEHWINLLKHCLSVEDRSSPAQKWLLTAKKLLMEVGQDAFAAKLSQWLLLVKELLVEIHKAKGYKVDFLRDVNHNLLKALIWLAGFTDSQPLISILDDYASWAYKKKPQVGPVAGKTGNACMYAFSTLPVTQGITRLMKFRLKVNNNTLLKGIEKIIQDVATKNNISKDELEDMGVSDFGLDENGILQMQMGDFTAVYTLHSMRESALVWKKGEEEQKTLPQAVKNNYAGELKNLKDLIKEIESLLPVLKERLEGAYLKQKTWTYQRWKEYYLDQPVMSILSKKLIWHFSDGDKKTEAIWLNGVLTDKNGKEIHPSGDTKVQLWHPIGFSINEILAWRNFLQQHQITQPFKQAHREIYVLTDAELNTDTYSNRFAGHILRQHQFAALCKQRDWSYHLMGQWDSHNTPCKLLPGWNIRIEYYVDADWEGLAAPSGIFTYIATDQVRFYREDRQLRMHEVPALVFTEIMRDVDLFVGVCSIGNDPGWQDAGDARMNTYWHNYSFGELTESAKVREDVLKNLIPRLKIGKNCSFDGKYLLVKGKLRQYKIHMGSGNILMEPNDQYLCIVRDRSDDKNKGQVFLPFEGDTMLSIIISKALLLADDDKIKDPTIVRQIKAE